MFHMSNLVGQPSRRMFGHPDRLVWPTKYYNFDWLASNMSAITVQWEDEGYWSANQLIDLFLVYLLSSA